MAADLLQRWLAPAALLVLSLAATVMFFALPLQPAYDTAYAVVWAHDLVHGRMPDLGAFHVPTEHPLAMLAGLLAQPLGRDAGRALVALSYASYVALVAGTFRLARVTFGAPVAWVAALLLVSRLDYGSLAFRSYIDIPYLACIVWAAALEVQRPRRGGAVWVLLIAAGLLRPEVWMLAGLYAIWLRIPADRWPGVRGPRSLLAALPRDVRGWVAPLALAGAAMACWCLVDLLLTGNPVYSLTYTADSAASLHHQLPFLRVPEKTGHFLSTLTKPPVFVVGIAGFILALWIAPQRAAVPAILFLAGVLTFWLIGFAGLAVIARYLAISALMLLIFAAVAIAGFSLLPPGTAGRRAWMAGAALAVLVAGGYTVTHTSTDFLRKDLRIRSQAPEDMRKILGLRAVAAARACGPIIVPTQKFIADARLVTGAPASAVLARSDLSKQAAQRTGVFLTPADRRLYNHPAYTPYEFSIDPVRVFGPPPDFVLLATFGLYAAYGRC